MSSQAGQIRVLIGCERFGVLRDAFLALGFDAWSCDLVDAPGQHFKRDVRDVASQGCWDCFIVHPDCTFLTVANTYINRGFSKYTPEQARARQAQAVEFFMDCIGLCERVGIGGVENPIGVMSRLYRKPDQIIQPWQFGDDASKATCLWLKNLPPLEPTKIVGKGDFYVRNSGKRDAKWLNDTGSKVDRAIRSQRKSKTMPGIARAMADQWGDYLLQRQAVSP